MTNLEREVHIFLKTLELKDKKVTVGFSGGADSTALLNILEKQSKRLGFNLTAVFFSHGNSPIAQDEDLMLSFCSTFCKEKNINFINTPLTLDNNGKGWESAGRQARQEFYKTINTDYVFLGHHQDDQNETTMTQLFRGAGKGTVAMADNDGFYCRPLINVYKQDIYDYLNYKKLTWIEDPTNNNNDFTRNFWRNDGLPTIEKHYPQYRKTLENFRHKQKELFDLAKEMAVNDGLNDILNNKNFNISKLSNLRIKNLITHIFTGLKKSMPDRYYEQQVDHYKANSYIAIEVNESYSIIINKGNIVLSNKPKKTNKP